MSFDQQFDLHDAWCREHALSLKALGEWMKDQELLDAAVQERLQWLEAQLRERRRNFGRRIEAIARIEQAPPLIQAPGVAAAPAESERVAA